MKMTMPVARVRISREINVAEDALNHALLKQSQLFTTLVTARQDVEMGSFTGHDALLRLSKSQQAMLAAGGDLARVHARLLDINRETGDTGETCPPSAQLDLVQEVAAG